jgi:nicotinic acid mononucleotide adenylyltransferase
LLIGCDQALHFHDWKDWQEILMLATPAVMLRPAWNRRSFEKQLRTKYSPVESEHWMKWTLNLPMMDISASQIRQRLQARDFAGLEGLLDPAVIDYIRGNGLYGAGERSA